MLAFLGIATALLIHARSLLHEPLVWQYRWFKGVAWLMVLAVVTDLGLRLGFQGINWLHSIYGVLAATIMYYVSALEPGGWLHKPQVRVGPYFFWAAFVSLLLWIRFIDTGIR
jgi:hypothetical protein